jgi:hypothetical protein
LDEHKEEKIKFNFFKKMVEYISGEVFVRVGDCVGFALHVEKLLQHANFCHLVEHDVKNAMFVAEESKQYGMLRWLIATFKEEVCFDKISSGMIFDGVVNGDIERVRVMTKEFDGRVDIDVLDEIVRRNLWEFLVIVTEEMEVNKIDKKAGDFAVLLAIKFKRWEMVERLRTCGFDRPRMDSSEEYICASYVDETDMGPKCASKIC